jgi:hypothetical protein
MAAAKANPRASTNRMAVASCALGMLTYVGLKSLAANPAAPPRQAAEARSEPAPASLPSSLPQAD